VAPAAILLFSSKIAYSIEPSRHSLGTITTHLTKKELGDERSAGGTLRSHTSNTLPG